MYRFEVSPDQRHLVAVGNFTRVGDRAQRRAFVLDLRRDRARLNPWHYRPLERACRNLKFPAQLTDVDWNPDSTYFAFSSTGGRPAEDQHGTAICDAAARFNLSNSSPRRPVWINYTGGDTLRSIAVTSSAVYVQGHQQWLDDGTVDRPGIGALDRDQPGPGLEPDEAARGGREGSAPHQRRPVGGLGHPVHRDAVRDARATRLFSAALT